MFREIERELAREVARVDERDAEIEPGVNEADTRFSILLWFIALIEGRGYFDYGGVVEFWSDLISLLF